MKEAEYTRFRMLSHLITKGIRSSQAARSYFVLILLMTFSIKAHCETPADVGDIAKDLQHQLLHETGPVRGHIRKDGKKVNFESRSDAGFLDLKMTDTGERFRVALKGPGVVEKQNGGIWKSQASLDASKNIPGTDIAFEDVAFRFLFWSDLSSIGSSFIRTRHCIGLRFTNPSTQAVYKYVDLWVDQNTWAPIRALVYGAGPVELKQLDVISFFKRGIHSIRITNNPGQNVNTVSQEYLEFEEVKSSEGN